ncbi:putative ATP-binding protein involved in virulence [Serratia fonticola]|jgi:predicted ATP-binding protein involved in virulence|uniref:Putative ATP-binding protein involved in virulence n=1 Tax=Serratia fonticola TaxID=47917 RepID=A0A559T5F8_SERFO|nr:AAA family ATPase [Serratia fonticola]TQI77688.1 putative ATP-binding protein involved in virulence [Serratia fonticola]TQI95318.1 putative ATP-binding protein involved in virulence [Serratia fonticola]TVZ69813.1 putative ATP-binding protein involved in virulence [Serratia fonticola]
MKINQISLVNYRCFERKVFSFHPEFNLIVGVNGTGKTALLEALSVALSTWLLGFRNKPDNSSLSKDDARLSYQEVSGRVKTTQHWPITIDTLGSVFDKDISWERSKESENGNVRYGKAGDLIALAKEADKKLRINETVILPLIAYYGTMRLWQEPRKLKQESTIQGPGSLSQQEKTSRLTGYRHSVDPRISIRSLVSWFAKESWVAFQNDGEESVSNQVVREAILGCVDGAERLFFDAKRGELLFDIADHEIQPFANLSDGQRCMLALVADIAQKAVGLNPHLGNNVLTQTPGVVLVDELDLHLHPKWQRRVIEDLRRTFPLMQFICTTHSPFLIQSLRSGEELLMLDGQPTAELNNKTLDNIAEGIMGVDDSETSERYAEMKETAKHYLTMLDEASSAPVDKLESFKHRLSESIAPYADNPAYQAFLEMKRAAKLGE